MPLHLKSISIYRNLGPYVDTLLTVCRKKLRVKILNFIGVRPTKQRTAEDEPHQRIHRGNWDILISLVRGHIVKVDKKTEILSDFNH